VHERQYFRPPFDFIEERRLAFLCDYPARSAILWKTIHRLEVELLDNQSEGRVPSAKIDI
jgi:hypothetical protein